MKDMNPVRQITVQTIDDLIIEIQYIKSTRPLQIVSIDGKDGTGKSTIARALSERLPFRHIELDRYLIRKQDHYVGFIRYHDLRPAISSARESGKVALIEGVCVQAVLNRLQLCSDLSIYVKRTGPDGDWYDERYFDRSSTREAIFEIDRENRRAFAKAMNEPYNEDEQETLFHEVVRYHFQFEPHITANITVAWNHSA